MLTLYFSRSLELMCVFVMLVLQSKKSWNRMRLKSMERCIKVFFHVMWLSFTLITEYMLCSLLVKKEWSLHLTNILRMIFVLHYESVNGTRHILAKSDNQAQNSCAVTHIISMTTCFPLEFWVLDRAEHAFICRNLTRKLAYHCLEQNSYILSLRRLKIASTNQNQIGFRDCFKISMHNA